ncbi:YigZ family protein [Candidatus Acetothermia bacterium]|nr:YigZ family protein [Candidatus Acetothermia bacterium]MBI3661045.1 YigZ family protein [Candidatus Acetothermia bacterium]
MDEFFTIREPARAQLQRERSRFLAFAFPVTSRSEVEKCLHELQQEFADATHHCYAYRLMERNQSVEWVEDAGEPAGSAGKPILRVITGRDLWNTLVVVVRYFGGVKLGVGGLMRAYSDSTKAVLALVSVVRHVRETEVPLRYPHAFTGEVMRLVNRYRAQIVKIEYSESPMAVVRLPAAQAADFERDLRDATRGQVELLPMIT